MSSPLVKRHAANYICLNIVMSLWHTSELAIDPNAMTGSGKLALSLLLGLIKVPG